MNYVNISNDQFCFYRYETKAVKWIYLYIFREQPHAQLGCIWKMLHWHIKACLVESVFGHLPTHEAWVMPNLIPIDFYIEGEPNSIYPLGCMQHFFFFFREMCYICPGHKSCLWGEQPKGFCHSVHETQRFQSVILKLSVLGYAIRWSGTGNQLDIPVEALQLGDHTFQGHMFIWQVESRWGDSTNLQGKDKNRRIWKALVFSHRD